MATCVYLLMAIVYTHCEFKKYRKWATQSCTCPDTNELGRKDQDMSNIASMKILQLWTPNKKVGMMYQSTEDKLHDEETKRRKKKMHFLN